MSYSLTNRPQGCLNFLPENPLSLSLCSFFLSLRKRKSSIFCNKVQQSNTLSSSLFFLFLKSNNLSRANNPYHITQKMSGGVGPSSDIRLPKEEEQHEPAAESYKTFSKKEQSPLRSSSRSFFTFRQMNALAVIIVLAASGLVSIEDFGFMVFSLIYLYFMSKMAFPSLSPYAEPRVFGEKNKILSLYVFIGAVIGLFLPIAYIFEGILEGDKEGIKAAAPHVFLLASQVFMEGVAMASGFSLPIQVFVPIIYNSMRIFTLVEWLSNEIYKADLEDSGSARRLYIGRALAIANMAFWSFNLFGFLLPIYLPKAFKMYYNSAGQKGKKV